MSGSRLGFRCVILCMSHNGFSFDDRYPPFARRHRGRYLVRHQSVVYYKNRKSNLDGEISDWGDWGYFGGRGYKVTNTRSALCQLILPRLK